jgi:hypothetical protein
LSVLPTPSHVRQQPFPSKNCCRIQALPIDAFPIDAQGRFSFAGRR